MKDLKHYSSIQLICINTIVPAFIFIALPEMNHSINILTTSRVTQIRQLFNYALLIIMAWPKMTGCQAGFSILQTMNDFCNNNEEQGMKSEKRTQKFDGNNLSIIDTLYEARMIIRVTAPSDESDTIVRFQIRYEVEDANIHDGADLEVYVRALKWMPAVHRIEILYGLSLGR